MDTRVRSLRVKWNLLIVHIHSTKPYTASNLSQGLGRVEPGLDAKPAERVLGLGVQHCSSVAVRNMDKDTG